MKKIFVTTVSFLILGIVLLALALFFYDDAYITTLLHYHDADVYTSYTKDPLAGTTIRGEVQAQYSNFGALKIRTVTFHRLNTGSIVFRLREKGTGPWIFSNQYAIDRFPDGLLYPFGFMPMPDSKGKTYEFEIVSKDGTQNNAIGIERGYHAVATQYVYQKSSLTKNKVMLIDFVKLKLQSLAGDSYFDIYAFLFLIPLIYFGLYRMWPQAMTRKFLGLFLYAAMIIIYIYLPVGMNSNIIWYVAAAGIFMVKPFGKRAPWFFAGAVALLCLIPMNMMLGDFLAANRSAVMVYFLLLSGVMMSLLQYVYHYD